MNIYEKVKAYISSNDVERLIEEIHSCEVKDLLFLLQKIQMSLYADYDFFSAVKKNIVENMGELKERERHIFNFLYCTNESEIIDDFEYILKDRSCNVLLEILLSGVVRNHFKRILERIKKTDLVLSERDKRHLAHFFIARGVEPLEVFQLLKIQEMDYYKKPKKRISVALLISGQIRGIETALDSWTKLFNFYDVDLDIFVSTWTYAGIPKKLDVSRICNDEIECLLKENPNMWSEREILDKLSEFLPPENITEEYLFDTLNNYFAFNNISIDIESEDRYPQFSNSMKLYYKIYKAFEMSRQKSYDLYIRIRPDIVVSGKSINLLEVEQLARKNNLLFAHYSYVYEYYGFGVDDKIAIAKHDLMEQYSKTWIDYFEDKKNMIGHTTLAYNLVSNNVRVAPISDLKIRFANYNIVNGKNKLP